MQGGADRIETQEKEAKRTGAADPARFDPSAG